MVSDSVSHISKPHKKKTKKKKVKKSQISNAPEEIIPYPEQNLNPTEINYNNDYGSVDYGGKKPLAYNQLNPLYSDK